MQISSSLCTPAALDGIFSSDLHRARRIVFAFGLSMSMLGRVNVVVNGGAWNAREPHYRIRDTAKSVVVDSLRVCDSTHGSGIFSSLSANASSLPACLVQAVVQVAEQAKPLQAFALVCESPTNAGLHVSVQHTFRSTLLRQS